MKRAVLLTGIALVMMSAPRNTKAQEVSFDTFYSSLSPYGEWVNAPDYGMCWRPVDVAPDWQPYTVGHWVWTSYGWTWISGFPWGWAPFHYGRWVLDPFYGWIWTPGYVWAPAWVQWRWGGGYCGWAPLPPGFHFRVDVVVGPDDRDFGMGIRGWNFVYAREMGSGRYRFVDRHAVPRMIGSTRNVTRIRFTSGGVYSVGLPREDVERFTGRRIRTVDVVRTNDIGRQRVVGNSVHIYSPSPFQPRIRDEGTVVQRERVNRAPERVRGGSPDAARPRREAVQPRVNNERNAPAVERRRQEVVKPKPEAQRRERVDAKARDRNEKDKKGPGHRH
jgi:Family of unknown function (DUF6600)